MHALTQSAILPNVWALGIYLLFDEVTPFDVQIPSFCWMTHVCSFQEDLRVWYMSESQ